MNMRTGVRQGWLLSPQLFLVALDWVTRIWALSLEVQGGKVGLKINATKTKLMRIGTERSDGVSVAGGLIEDVDEFTYLRSIVSKKGGTDEDIQARIERARQAFAMLRPIWLSTALTTKTKLRVFGSNVKAVLLYGS